MTEIDQIKGLGTVALLRANYDKGHDHIGMFYVFIVDVVAGLSEDHFGVSEVRDALARTHGLSVPLHTLKVLIGRGVKNGDFRQEAGRYFKATKLTIEGDLDRRRSVVEAELDELARSLMIFAQERGTSIDSETEALDLILAFFAQNELAVLLNESGEAIDRSFRDERDRKFRAAGRFIEANIGATSRDSDLLQRLLEGYVLQPRIFTISELGA